MTRLAIRLAYNSLRRGPKQELADFRADKNDKAATATTSIVSTGRGCWFSPRGLQRHSRAGPDMLPVMESELESG